MNRSHILFACIVREIGSLPGHRWMLIGKDCMIHGVDSERTERSSEEIKGHNEEKLSGFLPVWLSPLHFKPQSISLTRKY